MLQNAVDDNQICHLRAIRSPYLEFLDLGECEGLTATKASRTGNDLVEESGEVYACITSARTRFYDHDAEVEMKNGAILNNYDGRDWFSGTSYLLFRAYSGNWYTFTGFDNPRPERIQKEDLVREPETCFAFDEYSYVEDKYEGGSRGALMVINGEEIAVYDSCRIDVGAPVDAYYIAPSYNQEEQAWIFDLSSGRECEIFVP